MKAFAISEFVSPHPEETTAYIVYLMEQMEKIARLLGHDADAAEFAAAAKRVRGGYQHLVVTKKHSLDTERQAKLVAPALYEAAEQAPDRLRP